MDLGYRGLGAPTAMTLRRPTQAAALLAVRPEARPPAQDHGLPQYRMPVATVTP